MWAILVEKCWIISRSNTKNESEVFNSLRLLMWFDTQWKLDHKMQKYAWIHSVNSTMSHSESFRLILIILQQWKILTHEKRLFYEAFTIIKNDVENDFKVYFFQELSQVSPLLFSTFSASLSDQFSDSSIFCSIRPVQQKKKVCFRSDRQNQRNHRSISARIPKFAAKNKFWRKLFGSSKFENFPIFNENKTFQRKLVDSDFVVSNSSDALKSSSQTSLISLSQTVSEFIPSISQETQIGPSVQDLLMEFALKNFKLPSRR